MKKLLVVLLLVLCLSAAYAKRYKRPLVELGPKASLYIGSVNFGIGADVVINPLKNIGFRLDVTEVIFGDATVFSLNRGASLDAFIYIPMKGVQPYAFVGFGLSANGGTIFLIRGGMGFDFVMNKKLKLFAEPGIIFTSVSNGASDTDVTFRVSGGARFGIF